jgi:nucleoside-triphosphatase
MELERRTVSEHGLFRSPDSLLASFFSGQNRSTALVLLTGASGTGKTTWCTSLIKLARASGLNPAGIIAPAVFESGIKTGIDLLDIQSGERLRLATRRVPDRSPGAPIRSTLYWRFNEDTLTWGNHLLESLPESDILILDELGPLEFLENQGLVNGLKLIDQQQHNLACVSMRPNLLATAQERWPWATILEIEAHTA